MKLRAKYSVLIVTPEVILIKDECETYNTMSVTNNAEAVVYDVFKTIGLPANKKLFYIDTMNLVDQLEHDGNGEFIRFSYGFKDEESFFAFYKL